MSHRVPDLDANHGGSIGFNHLDNLDIRSGKGGADSVAFSHRDRSAVWSERDEGYLPEHRKQASAHVPENVFNHIPWMERESEKKNKHACSMGRESVPVLEVPLSHLLFQDDEMLSWLQYPLEDSFDKNYCSEPIFEQALNAPSHNAHDRFSHRTLREGEKLSAIGLPSQSAELSHSNVEGRTLTSDVAMAMGAFRVAGLLPQAGGEAFHRVRTTGQPSDPRETYEAPPPKATDALHVPSNAMDVHSALSLPSQHIAKQSALNFSLFSRPVAAMKTSLEILGTSTGPSNMEKTRKPFITHGNQGLSFSAAAVEFTAAASMSGLSSPVESDLSHQSKGKKQKTNCTSQRKCLPSMLSFRHKNNAGKEKVELNTHFKMSAGIGSETQTVDVTLTSPSGGSGNSSEKSVKETAASSCKRKSCPAEESECESKDAEEVAASEKQPASGRPSPAKRTRAAEIHNQSERKRRNKINDRMKALQELIPNSNKTDKASMLDEAIEYVKTLQAQLQLMSMRTGMVVPSVLTSPGMQYPSIQQRLVSSHMNMGMGVSMGLAMGIGMLDASATGVCAGRAVVAMPPFLGQPVPGPAYHVAGYQPSGSSSIVHEAQGHMHINEGHNLSTHQLQPLHLNLQISSDMRRAFMQQHQTQENFTSKEP